LLKSRPLYDHDAIIFEQIRKVLKVLDLEQVDEVGSGNIKIIIIIISEKVPR